MLITFLVLFIHVCQSSGDINPLPDHTCIQAAIMSFNMCPEPLIWIVTHKMCINSSPINTLLLSDLHYNEKRNLPGLLILKQRQAEGPQLHKTIKAHGHECPAVLCSTCISANAITLTEYHYAVKLTIWL